MHNASARGVIVVERPLRVLAEINQLLRVETGVVAPLYAKVRWRNQPEYGLVFERVLDFEELGDFCTSPDPDNPDNDRMVA